MIPLRRRKLMPSIIQKQSLPALPPLEKSLRPSSTVYKRHSLSLGLTPRLVRQTSDLRLQDWQRCGWKTPEPDVSLAYKYQYQTPKRRSSADFNRRSLLAELPASDLKVTAKSNVSGMTKSLPPLPKNGQRLLRRPRFHTTLPVSQRRYLFNILTQGKTLEPLSFEGNIAKTRQFYAAHYPLLMSKSSDMGTSTSGNDVVKPPRFREISAERRNKEMHHRISCAEELLRQLETDPEEDGSMKTELRDELFNPTLWPWNLKRYRLLSPGTRNERSFVTE